MKINEYIQILKKEYKAITIDFKKEIQDYFSRPDMYGKHFDIDLVSEGYIQSNDFKTIIIKGSSVDPFGKFDWGTKAIIVFAEYNAQQEIINHYVISSFFPKNKDADKKLYTTLTCYKKEL